jgi:hypothetical protein
VLNLPIKGTAQVDLILGDKHKNELKQDSPIVLWQRQDLEHKIPSRKELSRVPRPVKVRQLDKTQGVIPVQVFQTSLQQKIQIWLDRLQVPRMVQVAVKTIRLINLDLCLREKCPNQAKRMPLPSILINQRS